MSEFQGWWSRVVDGHEPQSAAGRHDARDWQEKQEGRNANEILGAQAAAFVLDRPPTRRERGIAAGTVHYAFGAAMGAAYGVLAARRGGAPPLSGAAWGTAVWLVADEVAMPLLGLARDDVDYPLSAHLQSWTAHIVFGLTTESVGRIAGQF
jgi:hypothetical protein